ADLPAAVDGAAIASAADWRAELTAAGAAPGRPGRRAAVPDEPPVARLDRTAPRAPAPDTSAATTIDELAGLIASCRACELFRTALNPVPGEGNPSADLVCVGEAPGATEDQLGRPFVGQAGQLLTKI